MTKRHPAADATVAVGYIRVSTGKQAQGPKAQRDAIERWARAHGVTIAAWCEDHGAHGDSPLAQRAGFLESLERLEEASAGLLIVAKLDRASRGDPIEAAMVDRYVQRLGARVQSAAGEGTDNDDPASVLQRRMVAAFAEYELSLIRERTKRALAAKKARGERTGGVPYGKRMAADGVHLEPCETEQATIAEARRLRGSGLTLTRIGAALTAAGRYPRQGTTWAPTQVSRMLA